MRIIKRYKNRRLYDTERKAYITHAELRLIIKSGIPFKIIDSENEDDITLAVLSRLLTGEVRNWQDIKESKDVLIEVINRGGEQSMSILKNTFLASVGIFNVTKKKAEESLEMAFEKGFEVLDTSEQSDIQGSHERKMERHLVLKALASLSPEMRSVIVLKVYEERTFEDISEILSIPTSTVKSRLYKALDTLGRNYRRRTLLREVTS